MAAHLEEDAGFFTRRGVVVFAILALHVFIAWALATGLARKAIEVLAPPIQTVIETETHKEAPPPPPPPPTFERPPVEIPPSDTVIEIPVAQATTAISNVTTQHVAPAPPPKAGVHKNAAIDPKHFPNSEDFYPPASRRNNEEGITQVHVCVAGTGKLQGDPTVEKGSGFPKLDEAAVTLAKAGRYVPGSDDGKPIDSCLSFNVHFKLHN
jgi:periplasmic protein TonB